VALVERKMESKGARKTEDVMKRVIGSFVLALVLLAIPATSSAAVAISITVAPPVLPVYVQPPCPADGYIWTPGYWAWGPAGYYWVPGVWVAPPSVGLLWTPGYWGFVGGAYLWHVGYWGPHVGFYGGVNYGFGYPGHGFIGGVWAGGAFRYNTAVVNVNRTVVRNVYVDRTVIHNTVVNNRASFNGPGGLNERPTETERAAMNEHHAPATSTQMNHESNNRPMHTETHTETHTEGGRTNTGHPTTNRPAPQHNAPEHGEHGRTR
jgi:hypothetical protein